MKKILSLLLVLIMLLSVCTTAGAEASSKFVSDKTFELNVNTNQKGDAELALITAAIEEYKKMYPNATVNINYGVDTSDFNDYATRLLSQFAGGETIDILWMAIEGIAFLADKGVIAPIDQYVDVNPDIHKRLYEDIAYPVLSCMMYDGKVYGMPLGWNNTLIMYNTRMFEENGIEYNQHWTWDEFVEVAKKLTKEGENGEKIWGLALNFNLSDYLPFLAANGTFDMNETATESWWNKPETIEAFQFVYDLIHKYGVCSYPEKTYYSSYFYADRIAMMMGGPWAISGAEAIGFDDFDFCTIPSNKGIKGCSFGGDGYCMTTACKNPQEALDFMNLLTNDDIQMMMAELGTSSPSTITASYSEEFLAHSPNINLHYDLVLDSEANARKITSPVYRPEMENAFSNYWSQALAGEITIEEMCLAMHEEVEAMIAEYE